MSLRGRSGALVLGVLGCFPPAHWSASLQVVPGPAVSSDGRGRRGESGSVATRAQARPSGVPGSGAWAASLRASPRPEAWPARPAPELWGTGRSVSL